MLSEAVGWGQHFHGLSRSFSLCICVIQCKIPWVRTSTYHTVSTGNEKHDLETYIKALVDYCMMQNWYDTSKESDQAKWTMPHKAMACLRAFLSPVARTVYKYSLGLSEVDSKKPYSVVNALREYYGDIVRASGERQKFLPLPFFLPFWQKRYPFYIPFIETSTPFTYLL